MATNFVERPVSDHVILGMGFDVADVRQMQRSVARFGEQFLAQFLSPDEIRECRQRTHSTRLYAARFAAKEAVAKGLGTGVLGALSWHDILVRDDGARPPRVHLSGKALTAAESLGVARIHLSLSSTERLAAAMVVLAQ